MPNYFSITKGRLITLTPIPSTIIIGDSLGPSTFGGNGNDLIISAWVLLTFNPIIEFFEDFHTNYQGVKIEKFRTLLEFQRQPHESWRVAYTQMQRLFNVTKGIIEA